MSTACAEGSSEIAFFSWSGASRNSIARLGAYSWLCGTTKSIWFSTRNLRWVGVRYGETYSTMAFAAERSTFTSWMTRLLDSPGTRGTASIAGVSP